MAFYNDISEFLVISAVPSFRSLQEPFSRPKFPLCVFCEDEDHDRVGVFCENSLDVVRGMSLVISHAPFVINIIGLGYKARPVPGVVI